MGMCQSSMWLCPDTAENHYLWLYIFYFVFFFCMIFISCAFFSLFYLECNSDFPPKDGKRTWFEALTGTGKDKFLYSLPPQSFDIEQN